MFYIIFLPLFFPSLRRWIIKVINCEKVNFAKDKILKTRSYCLVKVIILATRKNFLTPWVTHFLFLKEISCHFMMLQNQICDKMVCWMAVLSVVSTFLFCFVCASFLNKLTELQLEIIIGSFVAFFCLIVAFTSSCKKRF